MSWLAAFFVFVAFALDPIASSIEQAQSLAIKKNRKQACELLQRSLNQPSLSASGRTKLQEALNQISRVFFTDKGQKLFETAQSQAFENPELALVQYQQSLQMEDDNVLILANLAKAQLLKKDCDAAMATVDRGKLINAQNPELAMIELRALICQKKTGLIKERIRTSPGLNKWGEAFSQYILAQAYIEEKSAKKAFELLSKIADEFPLFPETFYYLALSSTQLNRDPEPWYERYVALCKRVTARDRRRYSEEPQLCMYLKDVENELAKKTVDL